MVDIHPTAIVHPDARVGEGSRIGAFSIVEAGARIGQNCDIQDHVVIRRHCTLGNDVKVFPFAVLGAEPQHMKFSGEESTVEIGNGVTIRESVTVHRGTSVGILTTRIGDNSFLMAYTHVAHDCIVGKNVIMANGVQLAGHVEIGDNAVLGGLSGVTQFCRVGRFCYVGSGSQIRKDLPPFLSGKGPDFRVQGINAVGLSRHGYSQEKVASLKSLYKIFYRRNLTVSQALEQLAAELGDREEVREFVDFVQNSKTGVVR